MISKPPSNWSDEGRVTAAAQSAVATAQYAAGATKRGFSLVKAVFLGGFAVLWGFAGLAQLLIGGGLGGAAQGASGLMIVLLAAVPGYFAWRNLKKAFASSAAPQSRAYASEANAGWQHQSAAQFRSADDHRGFAQQPPAFSAPRGGGRHEVQNSQTVLVKALLFGVVMIPIGLFLMNVSNPIVKLIGLAGIIAGPFMMLKTARGLIGGSAAFSYDSEGITVPGWFGEKHLAWREIGEFSVQTLSTYAFGFVKTSTQYSLYACKIGGGKMLLPTQFTGLDVDGLSELIARLELFRVGGADVAARLAQNHSSGYSPAAPPPPPGFGRRDAEAPYAAPPPFANRPNAAAAPSFGRRQGAFGDR